MPNMEIKSYTVGTNRQQSSNNYHRRYLLLEPKNPTNEVKHIVVYFFIQETIENDTDIGYQTPTSTKYVVGLAPVADFGDMYNILQTEKPVFFSWAAANNNKLYWFGLSSTEESPGEGPKDSNA